MADQDISDNGKKRIYRILCHLAYCDGEVSPEERARLDIYRKRFGFDAKDAVLIEAQAADGKDLSIGKNSAERDFLVQAMVDIVAADGKLDPKEEKRVLKVGKILGIDVKDLVGWLRSGLH